MASAIWTAQFSSGFLSYIPRLKGINMSNVLNKRHKNLSESEIQKMKQIKDESNKLLDSIDRIDGDKRMIAFAKTNLEQAVRWAIKAIKE